MNKKNTDSQKLKYLHLTLKGKGTSLKTEAVSSKKQVVFWVAGIIGIILIVWGLIVFL